jgi:hypothetical protein
VDTLRRFIGRFWLAALYLLATAALGLIGWDLQHTVFHPPPPAGQMYAAVFVRDPAAHVNLSAEVYPYAPWTDSLSVTVSGVSPRQAGWLLVIECPAGAPSQSRTVQLYSATAPQTQAAATLATVHPDVTNRKSTALFDCFPSPGGPQGLLGTSGYTPSLANVSVPALQLDQNMVGASGLPVLYAEQNRPGGAVSKLVQVFPGVGCPSAAPTTIPTASSSGAASPSPSVSPSASPSVSPSASPSPSPSASSQPSAPANPSCLNLAPPSATFIPYEIPFTETTTETLNNVATRGYQISMFPNGDPINEKVGEESIIWSSPAAALDPNFDATNTAAESDANRAIFISGVLFGILGGTAVAFVDHLHDALSDKKGKPRKHWISL